jgi:Xaa-Pro aminopeptidase
MPGPADSAEVLLDEPLGPVSAVVHGVDAKEAVKMTRRRADIDGRQEFLGRVLEEMQCEGVVLLVPQHVNWFTGGLNLRGLMAETERPGIYTNGRQRWLLCSSVDTQRFFDEELDGLGFQVKEWQWATGRAVLLAELVVGKKFAVDRPFPNLPQIGERLRLELRVLSSFEREAYRKLGRQVAHAVEATARTLQAGQSEEEIAGQLSHRLYHRGIEAHAVSVGVDGRGMKYRRTGFTRDCISKTCTLQATGQLNGLYCTAARTVSFGPLPADHRTAFDTACKLAALFAAMSVPGETTGGAVEAAKRLLTGTPHEFDLRASQPGYGTGRVAAEELRRAGADEKFEPGWAITWQPRLGPAAVADTVIVTEDGGDAATTPDGWPFKKITVKGRVYEVADALAR